MNRDETVALFLQGREAWNAWAEKMLAEQRTMQEMGLWAAESPSGVLRAKNNETHLWAERAKAEFSDVTFGLRQPEAARSGLADNVETADYQTPGARSAAELSHSSL